MSVGQLMLEVQFDHTLESIEEGNLLHRNSYPCHVIVFGSRVLVPDGDNKALLRKIANAGKLKGFIPHRVKSLVFSPCLHFVLLEPGLGVSLPIALLVEEVHQGVGVLASSAKELVR